MRFKTQVEPSGTERSETLATLLNGIEQVNACVVFLSRRKTSRPGLRLSYVAGIVAKLLG